MKNNNYCIIYLVRHGQSEANAINRYGMNTKLTQKGKEQAKELAKILKNVHFDAVFSSPLIRAMETVKTIADERKLEILTKEALRERYEGIVDGKYAHELTQEIKDRYKLRENLPYEEWKTKSIAEGYETDEHLMSRFITSLREIAVAYPGKTILIGSHSGIIRTLLVHLGLKKHKEVPNHAFKNTGYLKLKTDGVDFFVKEIHGLQEVNEK